ncbi:MAG TPA: UvrB/UvrC motif-containing protein [Patescibacteria group bacterium]|nr:UvrB/UvrC motif-containing protein [Patescibacteria group bacterium]
MLCSICKEKEATVFFTHIEGDKVKKVDVCEECYKTKGANDPAAFSLADMLLGLGASQEIDQAAGGVELKCTRCGFTQADFKKAGRLGCPECYKTFADGLEGLLKSMHKGTRHVGKVPESLRQTRDLSDRLRGLQKKLAKAVEDENFEQAALLRDEIKQMSARLSDITTS